MRRGHRTVTAALFVAYVALVAGLVVVAIARYRSRRGAVLVAAGIGAWLACVGLLAALGVVRDPTLRPPGIAYVVGPICLFFILVAGSSSVGLRLAQAVPLPLLIGAQGFRIGVEFLLHRLWTDGLVPRMLTFEGANVDLLVGVSAPVVAWLTSRGIVGKRLALAWNALGLAALANVVVRSALSAPGPLHLLDTEVPNVAIGSFPFVYLAGFLAPVAVALHVLAIRALRAGPRIDVVPNVHATFRVMPQRHPEPRRP